MLTQSAGPSPGLLVRNHRPLPRDQHVPVARLTVCLAHGTNQAGGLVSPHCPLQPPHGQSHGDQQGQGEECCTPCRGPGSPFPPPGSVRYPWFFAGSWHLSPSPYPVTLGGRLEDIRKIPNLPGVPAPFLLPRGYWDSGPRVLCPRSLHALADYHVAPPTP